ncbi:RCC1 repeat-containing protein [Archangium lansingense]|uniref:RCC1 domain-containing protein n=1 Tax=Archangium lansingense TaxID=2995310 RepID=UPI003B80FA56
MALLTAVMMTGCGTGEEQPLRHPAAPPLSRAALEDPGLAGRAWDAPLRDVLAAGRGHSLALDADGSVWAWGYNHFGQLGDGTLRNRSLPVKLTGLEQMKSVVAGPQHTLALREDGTVWGWGENQRGQLGRPSSFDPDPVPAQVPGLTGVVALATSTTHSLALREDGTVWSWGDNQRGQLGDGTGVGRYTPAPVPGLTGIVALSARGEYSLALRTDGTVWSWGSNQSGQLGRPESYNPNPTPEQVPGLTGVVALSAGEYHVLALHTDGTVWSWGDNSNGQLGRTTEFANDSTPVQVPGLTHVAGLAAGSHFSLALRKNGTVWAWGGNTSGQLTPRQVEGVKHVIALVAGAHPLVMSKNGIVWAWGSNGAGELGTGTDLRPTPVQVQGLSNAMNVTAGRSHFLTLRTDGTVWGWGANWQGQLGDGSRTQRASPVQVQNLSEVVAISAGTSHSLALRADGTVWGWGDDFRGQLGGHGTGSQTTPVRVPGLTDVVAIRAAGAHSLALRADGTVWAWGANTYGQLGRPANYAANPTPAQVPGLTDVVALASGDYYVLALRADGTVWGWGTNSTGQLGRPANYAANPIPAQVPGLTGVVALSAYEHVLALREDGTVWAWGANWQGQLGDGTRVTRHTPAPVPGLTEVKDITAASGNSLVVRQDGTVWGFGTNDYLQVANTEQSSYLTPVQRPDLAGVTALASGGGTVVALREDGTLMAWGSNANDKIGDGVSSFHATPTRVRLPCRFTGMPSRDHRASEARHCPATP